MLNADTPRLGLIQPLDDRSPYAHWLAAGGAGIHHLGFVVEDLDATTAAMQRAGFAELMSGSGHGADGSGAYRYFDTASELGFTAEAIQPPLQRRAPDAVIP